MGQAELAQARARALTFLQQAQTPDGSFVGLTSATERPFNATRVHHTTFVPSLVLGALSGVSDPVAQTIRQRLATWLLAERSPQWSFNYWAHQSPERSTNPYPDDLDDTFCALIGLHRHDPSLIDETCLGHVVRLLLATESQVGGPYRTWLVPENAAAVWQDVDVAVNSNVACFLQAVAQTLPNVQHLLEQAIVTRTFRSPYYPSAYPLLYYVARAYQGSERPVLRDYILKLRTGGAWQTPLQTALALTALVQLDTEPAVLQPGVALLQATQQADGSWPAEAFWMDTTFHGAAALTTSLVVEALQQCETPRQATHTELYERKTSAATERRYQKVMNATRQSLHSVAQPLRAQTQAMVDIIDRAENRQEIVLLPYFFAGVLAHRPQRVVDTLCTALGQANTFGWMAYTIYDDFLDGEGQAAMLSVANLSLRRSLHCFRQALPRHVAFQRLVEQTFDTIDTANAWEIANCRMLIEGDTLHLVKLPRYKTALRLADRSLGHALTPLGLLAAADVDLASKQAQAMREALRHYLAARQLHDDAHDWEVDMRAGHCSYVVVAILEALGLRPSTYSLTTLLPRMKREFWHHTLPRLCASMTHQLHLARRTLQRSGYADQSAAFVELIEQLEASVARTQREQAGAEKFLTAYQRKPAQKS